MARDGLSFEQVEAAAKRIEGRNERVTLRSVRAELGSGSMTTISRHLEDYQGGKKREVEKKISAGLELPARIVEAINAEIEAARLEVTETLQGELEEAKADRDALVFEVERLKEENEALVKETSEKVGQLREKAETAEKRENILQNRVSGLETELAQIKIVLSNTQRDLATEQFKFESQAATLRETKEELKQERREHSNTKTKCTEQAEGIKTLERNNSEKSATIEELSAENKDQNATIAQILAVNETQKKEAEQKLYEQEKATKAAKAMVENYKVDFEKLNDAFIQLTEQSAELNKLNDELLFKVREKELELSQKDSDLENLKAKTKKTATSKAE